MSNPTAADEASDREAIFAHIDGLFRAYQRLDFDAIRRGHTDDWRGFQLPSRALVHGIEAYMGAARRVTEMIRSIEGWEFLEREIEFHGDLALVWYVARETIVDAEGTRRTMLLRSIDLYRREPEGWNQCGSHITGFPD
jgi:ketosteroid isomerase-like protein